MSWYAKFKEEQKKPAAPSSPLKTPRIMSPTELIVHLRQSPELRDGPKNPLYAEAHAKLTAAYREIYGDRMEEEV